MLRGVCAFCTPRASTFNTRAEDLAADIANAITESITRSEMLVALTLGAAALSDVNNQSEISGFASIAVSWRVVADGTIAIDFITESADFFFLNLLF